MFRRKGATARDVRFNFPPSGASDRAVSVRMQVAFGDVSVVQPDGRLEERLSPGAADRVLDARAARLAAAVWSARATSGAPDSSTWCRNRAMSASIDVCGGGLRITR